MRKLVLLLMVLCVMCAPAWATHIIDTFDGGTANQTATNSAPTPTADTSLTSSAIGGERVTSLEWLSGGSPSTAQTYISSPGAGVYELQYDNGSGVDSILTLDYGLTTELGENFSDDPNFIIDVKGLDLSGVDMTISLWTGDNLGDADGQVMLSTGSATAPPAFSLSFPMTDFGLTSIQLEEIDRIQLTISPTTDSTDLRIDTIRTGTGLIPEPATLSLFGIGGLAALIRRRRNRA